jgi:hypothetical protein
MLNVYVYACSVRATEGKCVCCVKKRTDDGWTTQKSNTNRFLRQATDRARSVNSSVGIHVFDCCIYASNGRMTGVPRTSNAREVRGTYAVKMGLMSS